MPIPLVNVGALLDPGLTSASPELEVVVAPGTHPLALLPVRLETRYFDAPDGQTELRVRIYPDRIHIDSHDPALTAEEAAAGRAYWEQAWRAADDEARARAAWQLLTERLEPGRAAYVAHTLTPTNPARRPVQPVPEEAELPTDPKFPATGDPSTVSRTPVARGLPVRWTATAYRDGQLIASATSRDVAPDLAVGPDLDDTLAPDVDDHEVPAVDAGMAWMVDFARAEESGMALRLLLPGPRESAAVDVLLVSGVDDSSPASGSARLADLLDAHRFTEGLEVLAPGTPTNNTTGERSGFASRDVRGARSFDAEWHPVDVRRGDTSAAALLADACGLDPERAGSTLGHLQGAERHDRDLADAMTTALWPATWGYYLTQMVGLGTGGLTPEDCDWGRDHARRFVVPAGPLPAVRCASQPYGILPVTSLNRWLPATADDARLDRVRRILVGLRDHAWRPAQEGVARVGRSDDASLDVVDVLRTDGAPAQFHTRRMMGPHLLRHLRLFIGEDLDAAGFWLRLQSLTRRFPDRIGLGFLPLVSRIVYEPETSTLTAPLVAAPEATASYVAELMVVQDLDTLAAPVPAEPVPLLRALLRHALLREQAQSAARLLASPELPIGQLLRDAELVDLVGGAPPTPTWTSQREQPVPGSSPQVTVREALADPSGLPSEIARPLEEFQLALTTLAAADVTTLERHLTGTLAAASYRLDAWVTSLATRRLADLRAAQPTGLFTGCYGWVENLTPDPQTPVEEVPPDEEAPLFEPADDPGFIHAPSLDQASAAALLRNAHLSQGNATNEQGPFAIQLTSERVRTAQRLLDGVRQGQTLGTLLGYDFERRLHDTGLDQLLDEFRRAAPPLGRTGDEAVERRVLLDGLVLRDLWADPDNAVFDFLDSASAGDRTIAEAALNALSLEVDAVADAITAEGAYQLVRGSTERASATMEDVASGDAAPPMLDHARTPRSSLPVTHRVAIVLDADASTPESSGWAAAATSPRAAADPALNAWLGRLLGRARDVNVALSARAADSTASHEISLAELGLTPLDLAWLSGDATGRDQLAELAYDAAVSLEDRIHEVRLQLDPVDGSTPGRRSIADLLEIAASAHGLVTAARPLDGVDLLPPHVEGLPGLDLDEYDERSGTAQDALQRVHDQLDSLLQNRPGPARADLRTTLRAASEFGVPVVTVAFVGADDESEPMSPDLVAGTGAAGVLVELARRLAAAGAASSAPAGEPDAARRARIQRRFAAVFGQGFVPLPRFDCPTGRDLRLSMADGDNLTAGNALASYTWLMKMKRLRPALSRLDLLVSEADAAGATDPIELELAQLPHEAGQRWVGLPVEPEATLREGVVSLALLGDGLRHLDRPLAGVLVDEWTESLPFREETTGIAFRYDPPDAAAPQAVLLAVPPVIGEDWTVGTLNQVLLETLDLAHLRAVGPEDLDAVGHYLPATALAFNAEGDAVATDLNPLTT